MPTWYVLLWAVVLILAILSRSLVAYIAMLFVWGLGLYYISALNLVDLVSIGLTAVFVLGMGYTAIEMVVNVKKL